MSEHAVVRFVNEMTGKETELEIPLSISANDLIVALDSAYSLGMDTENLFGCHLVSENPIAFLHGNRELSEYGIRNGSRIIFRGN